MDFLTETDLRTILNRINRREGMNQTRIAKLLGVKQQHVSNILLGKRAITKDIAAKLGFTLSPVFTVKESKRKRDNILAVAVKDELLKYLTEEAA